MERYIKECDTCAKSKSSRHKPYGLLQSIPTPEKAWDTITLDFVVKLPPSPEPLTKVQYDSILVINDKTTKYGYFIPYKEASSAEDLAYALFRTVIAQHGIPKTIISDRDKLFTSKFWQSLMDLIGTKQKLSTSYHPQTDGQTERTNQTLEQYLRCYSNYEQTNWVTLLPIAQLAYNNATNAAGISPFYANYGFHPNVHSNPRGVVPIAERAQVKVDKLTRLHEVLKQELDFISTRMTEFANRKRSVGPDLEKGGMVYLLRKNIQTQRPSNKLDHTKLGPFKIKNKKGPVTYELELPREMRIHPTFHISLLEPAATRTAQTHKLELSKETQIPKYTPEKIIGHKYDNGIPYYLTHWKDHQPENDSWEPQGKLTQQLIDDYHHRHQSLRGQRAARRTTRPTPPPNQWSD